MKPTQSFRCRVPGPRRPGKFHRTRCTLSRQQTAQAFPGAQPDLASREMRNLPQTPEAIGRDMHHGGCAAGQ
jgi:hypothetical protein